MMMDDSSPALLRIVRAGSVSARRMMLTPSEIIRDNEARLVGA